MKRSIRFGSLLIVAVLAVAGSLAVWKHNALRAAATLANAQPEPVESVSTVLPVRREYRPTTTAIGTVLALRSVTLRNELPGTVRKVALTPGQVVERGSVLVMLDVSVEQAELDALRAQAALAESVLARVKDLREEDAVSEEELDRARAGRDVAIAQIARTRAIIERKTIRAPFRARIGLSDVHDGQYLNEGTQLTTLQGVDQAVHVDFAVEQRVAAGLRNSDTVEVVTTDGAEVTFSAAIVAVDSRIDVRTRNAMVRARIDAKDSVGNLLVPGASVRVVVPTGKVQRAVTVPASALRKRPGGDHVFVLIEDGNGETRAHQRPVVVAAHLGDEVVIRSGLDTGEAVAAAGSFKLRDAVLVAPTESRLAAGSVR